MAVLDVFSASALLYVIAPIVVSLLVRVVYRLTLHPLAAFPGPKLAAITNMYGASFDLSFSSSSYIKTLPDLHAKYGPIIRAWPNQLHIHDLDAYNQVFKAGTKFPKERSFYTSYSPLNGSLFEKQDPKDATARRSLFSSYLSRESVRRAEPLVQTLCSKFLGILQAAAQEDDGNVVNLGMGFRALASDTVMDFTFSKPLGALDAPGFAFNVTKALNDGAVCGQWSAYFPDLFRILLQAGDKLPLWFLDKYMKPLALTKLLLRVSRERILELEAQPTKSSDHIPSIFETALNPDVEKGKIKPTVDELAADTLLFLMAGTDTTAHSLTIATYNVLKDPNMLKKLQAELRAAMPRKDTWLECAELEKLPYLRGVVKESLRGSSGTPGRLPRVAPPTGAVLCGQRIPPGTIVSSAAHVYHHDPTVFPDPEVFIPERWLVGAKESSELEKNMMPFSRGSRQCPGQNLAQTELHLTLAHLFRRFDMSIHETTAADMEWKDCVSVQTMGDLKVKVREAKD